MARATIADLLDEAASKAPREMKLDGYLDSLPESVRERVIAHLDSNMPSRRIAIVISEDPSSDFTISPSAVDSWRDRRRKALAEGS